MLQDRILKIVEANLPPEKIRELFQQVAQNNRLVAEVVAKRTSFVDAAKPLVEYHRVHSTRAMTEQEQQLVEQLGEVTALRYKLGVDDLMADFTRPFQPILFRCWGVSREFVIPLSCLFLVGAFALFNPLLQFWWGWLVSAVVGLLLAAGVSLFAQWKTEEMLREYRSHYLRLMINQLELLDLIFDRVHWDLNNPPKNTLTSLLH